MEELVMMKYKDFDFPSNPSKIVVKAKTNISEGCVIGESPNVSSNAKMAKEISGNGVFFDDKAIFYAQKLCDMLLSTESGILIVPGVYPMDAFFSDFSYEIDTKKNCVSYSFSFVEDCKNKNLQYDFGFTYAKSGENAFDIANRTGTDVETIIKNNVLSSPFEIKSGDKVVL